MISVDFMFNSLLRFQ